MFKNNNKECVECKVHRTGNKKKESSTERETGDGMNKKRSGWPILISRRAEKLMLSKSGSDGSGAWRPAAVTLLIQLPCRSYSEQCVFSTGSTCPEMTLVSRSGCITVH